MAFLYDTLYQGTILYAINLYQKDNIVPLYFDKSEDKSSISFNIIIGRGLMVQLGSLEEF